MLDVTRFWQFILSGTGAPALVAAHALPLWLPDGGEASRRLERSLLGGGHVCPPEAFMNRRAFLFGTIASLALPAVARSGTLGIDLPQLRGSLAVPETRPVARRTGDRSVELQAAINRAASAGRPLRIPARTGRTRPTFRGPRRAGP